MIELGLYYVNSTSQAQWMYHQGTTSTYSSPKTIPNANITGMNFYVGDYLTLPSGHGFIDNFLPFLYVDGSDQTLYLYWQRTVNSTFGIPVDGGWTNKTALTSILSVQSPQMIIGSVNATWSWNYFLWVKNDAIYLKTWYYTDNFTGGIHNTYWAWSIENQIGTQTNLEGDTFHANIDFNPDMCWIKTNEGLMYGYMTVAPPTFPSFPPLPIPQWDFTNPLGLLNQYFAAGDFMGFILAIYANVMGELILGVIVLIITIPLYLRTESLAYVSVVWILLGGAFVYLFPAGTFKLAYILVALGVGGLLYKLFSTTREN